MKKFFFSVAALAAAMTFTACSSEDVVVNGDAGIEPGSTGYMAFTINLPKDNGTRANDVFDKGEADEYKVHNGILILFDGANEANAEFHSAYDLGSVAGGEVWGTPQNGNVTVDKKYIAKIENAPSAPKAFVVLNNNGIFGVDGTTHTLTVNGKNFPTGHKFSELQAMTQTNLNLNATDFTNTGILMMNAHLWSQKGEVADPTLEGGKGHILATVAENNIYKTKAEAEAGAQATSIFVERAVAKVTVKSTGNVAESGLPFTATVNNWVLDNTNKSSYLIRSTTDFNSWAGYQNIDRYRMVGNNSVGHTSAISQGTAARDYYRTYFAMDTNFGVNVVYGTDTNKGDITSNPVAVAGSAYCAENTFDVERMTYGNTTRVILAATLVPATDQPIYDGGFYSKPGDTTFYTEDQMKTLLHNYVNSTIIGLVDKIDDAADLTYTITPGAQRVDFTVKVGNIKAKDGISTTDAALITELTSTTGKSYSIHVIGYDYYAGGVSYYDARIQHFGKDHTPWTAHEATTVAAAYGTGTDRDDKFLGRWGVLRNNWYELDVTKVTKIGYAHPWNLSFDPGDNPDDPEGTNPPYDPNVPDDNQKSELWISVDVNILSWAKRFQNVEL